MENNENVENDPNRSNIPDGNIDFESSQTGKGITPTCLSGAIFIKCERLMQEKRTELIALNSTEDKSSNDDLKSAVKKIGDYMEQRVSSKGTSGEEDLRCQLWSYSAQFTDSG